MVCRQCGTEIADRAIICYKCGTATAVPAGPMAGRPVAARRNRTPIVVVVLVLLAAAAYAAWRYFSGA